LQGLERAENSERNKGSAWFSMTFFQKVASITKTKIYQIIDSKRYFSDFCNIEKNQK